MKKMAPAAHVLPAGVPGGDMLDHRLRSLHDRHGPFLLRFLSWCCGVRGDDVKDVAQLVWIQVHKLGPTANPSRPWITGLAKNVAANERRKANRRRDAPSSSILLDPAAPDLTPEELLALRAYLRKLTAVLTPEHREALFLAAEGLTAAEIGEIQGITASNARQRVHEARKRLKQTEGARLLPLLFVGFEDFIKPLPPEELERRWNDLEAAIRRHEAPGEDGEPAAPPSLPPVVLPPVPAPPSSLPHPAPKLVSALAGMLLGAAALWLLAPAPATCHGLPLPERSSESPPAESASPAAQGPVASEASAGPSVRPPPITRPAGGPQQHDLRLRARSRRWAEERQ